MKMKTEINKWDLIKLKSSCTAEIINKTIDKINLQNLQAAHSAQYQKNNPIKKQAEDLNWHLSKEDI